MAGEEAVDGALLKALRIADHDHLPRCPQRPGGGHEIGDPGPRERASLLREAPGHERYVGTKPADLPDGPAIPAFAVGVALGAGPPAGRTAEPQQRHYRPVIAPRHLDHRR